MEKEIIKSLNEYDVSIFDIVNDKDIKSKINQRIQNIFVINLLDNMLRRNYIIVLMKKYNINYKLVVVSRIMDEFYHKIKKQNPDLTREEIGCCLSHLWCLKNIIFQQYQNSIIFEDDIIFHKNFMRLFEKTFKNEGHYDFLLLGRCDFQFRSLNSKFVNDGLYRPHPKSNMLYGAHANYYSLEGAKKMFEIKVNDFSFFDSDYKKMFHYFNKTSYICYPDLVVCDLSTTNLDHHYFLLTNMEKNYYTNCFTYFHFDDYHFIYLDLLNHCKDIEICKEDDYKRYMNKLLECYFFTEIEREEIRKRLSMNFFTIKDITDITKWVIDEK